MERRAGIKLGAIVIVSYLVLTLIIGNFTDLSQYESTIIDDHIKVTIINEDGKTATYESGETFQTVKGDRILAEIQLPKEMQIKNASIIIHIYNSVVQLYYKDQQLFQYGKELAEKGRMIGGVFVRACIPEEAWGESLRLEAEVMEDGSVTEISDVMALQTINSLRYFVINHETELVAFITVLFVSLAIFSTLLFYGRWTKNARKAMYLALCCTCLSFWLICNNGMYYLLSDNARLFSNMEYILIFISPLPILLYLYEEKRASKYRLFYGSLTGAYVVLFTTLTFLNYTTSQYHYTRWLPLLHSVWGGIILLAIVSFIRKSKRKNPSGRIVECGMLVAMIGFSMEITRYNIEKYTSIEIGNLKSVLGISILILLVTMGVTYAIKLGESILGEKEKEYLQRLAYLDGLTGLANRAGCYEYFQNMNAQGSTSYTVVYMDLNNLKPLNDNYGHNEGDRLLRFFAETLRENLIGRGFCGRLGGDEFIAVVEEQTIETVLGYMNRIKEKFDEANRNKEFLVEVSVAYGMAESTQENQVSIFEAIKIADYNMYESKKRYKENK